jgi:hypothetical protein
MKFVTVSFMSQCTETSSVRLWNNRARIYFVLIPIRVHSILILPSAHHSVNRANIKLLVTFSLFLALHEYFIFFFLIHDGCRDTVLLLTYCYLISSLLFGQELPPLIKRSLFYYVSGDCGVGLHFEPRTDMRELIFSM